MADQEEKEVKNEDGESLTLEESFERLDDMLEKLESRDIPLEDAFAVYQQAVSLLKQCSDRIDTVEKKIQVLNEEGGLDEF